MLIELYIFITANMSLTPASDRLFEDVNTSGLLVADSVEVMLVALPLSYCGIILIELYIFVIANMSLTPASDRLFEDVNTSGLLVADSVEVMLVALPLSYCGIMLIDLYIFVTANMSLTPASYRLLKDLGISQLLVANSVEVLLVCFIS